MAVVDRARALQKSHLAYAWPPLHFPTNLSALAPLHCHIEAKCKMEEQNFLQYASLFCMRTLQSIGMNI